jgi:hypothetical protein
MSIKAVSQRLKSWITPLKLKISKQSKDHSAQDVINIFVMGLLMEVMNRAGLRFYEKVTDEKVKSIFESVQIFPKYKHFSLASVRKTSEDHYNSKVYGPKKIIQESVANTRHDDENPEPAENSREDQYNSEVYGPKKIIQESVANTRHDENSQPKENSKLLLVVIDEGSNASFPIKQYNFIIKWIGLFPLLFIALIVFILKIIFYYKLVDFYLSTDSVLSNILVLVSIVNAKYMNSQVDKVLYETDETDLILSDKLNKYSFPLPIYYSFSIIALGSYLWGLCIRYDMIWLHVLLCAFNWIIIINLITINFVKMMDNCKVVLRQIATIKYTMKSKIYDDSKNVSKNRGMSLNGTIDGSERSLMVICCLIKNSKWFNELKEALALNIELDLLIFVGSSAISIYHICTNQPFASYILFLNCSSMISSFSSLFLVLKLNLKLKECYVHYLYDLLGIRVFGIVCDWSSFKQIMILGITQIICFVISVTKNSYNSN